MLKRTVRDLAVSAITIISATMLIALGATGASAASIAAANPGHAYVAAKTVAPATRAAANASKTPDSTLPNCNTRFPRWPCVQVFGNGTFISSMNGWAHNATGIDLSGDSFWNELYYFKSSPSGPNTPGRVFIRNCAFTSFPINGNSPNCNWAPNRNEPTGYYCDALWQWILGPNLWGYKCVYVHP